MSRVAYPYPEGEECIWRCDIEGCREHSETALVAQCRGCKSDVCEAHARPRGDTWLCAGCAMEPTVLAVLEVIPDATADEVWQCRWDGWDRFQRKRTDHVSAVRYEASLLLERRRCARCEGGGKVLSFLHGTVRVLPCKACSSAPKVAS